MRRNMRPAAIPQGASATAAQPAGNASVRRPLLLALALLLLPVPAVATTGESDVLTGAMQGMASIATDLNAGTLTIRDAADQAVAIRDDRVGALADYSDPCLPLAVYVHTTAQAFALALSMASLEELQMARGHAMVVAALFAYPAQPTGVMADAIASCAGGL